MRRWARRSRNGGGRESAPGICGGVCALPGDGPWRGAEFGLIIGIAQKFELATVHAHLNLLGWVSMALIGILHAVVPALRTAKSDLSFWVYQLSFPAFMISMFGTLLHNPVAEIAIRITATLMVVSVIWIAVSVFRSVGKDA